MSSSGGSTNHRFLGLVVHGIGEETVGSTLHCVVKEFFPLIRRSIDPETAGIDVVPLDDAQPAQVRLSFRANGERYQIVVREVHWAGAFAPPSVGGVGAGLWALFNGWLGRLRGGPRSARLAFFVLLGRLLYRAFKNAVIVAAMIAGLVLAVPLALLALFGGWSGVIKRVPGAALLSYYRKFQPSVVELAYIPIAVGFAALFLVLVVLERIGPLNALLPDYVAKVRTQLVTIVTLHIGDVSVYATQPWEASQIRTRFEDRFKQLVDDDDGGKFNQRVDNEVHVLSGQYDARGVYNVDMGDAPPEKAEAVFVIAHSLGCPVSYEALSGRRMKEFIAEKFKARKLYYFTVGSALPAIWSCLPESEGKRLYRQLPPELTRWDDFISKYDPVKSDLVWQSAEEPAGVTKPNEEHEVINQMDIFSEHSAYWNNVEQVLKPILNVITGGSLASQLGLPPPTAKAPVGRRRMPKGGWEIS